MQQDQVDGDEREELRILQTRPAERTLPEEPLVDLPPLAEIREAIAAIGLEPPVRSYVVALARATREQTMPALAQDVKIVPARLGDRAIVMGAAKMAWDRFAMHGES